MTATPKANVYYEFKCDGCSHAREQHSSSFGEPCDAERCYCPFFTNRVAELESRAWLDSTGMST